MSENVPQCRKSLKHLKMSINVWKLLEDGEVPLSKHSSVKHAENSFLHSAIGCEQKCFMHTPDVKA